MAVRFAMCNEFCEGWSFSETCRLAADAGYEGIEIAPFTIKDSVEDITPSERQQLKNTAEKSGLDVVGLHWLLTKPPGMYINHPDDAIRSRTKDYLKAEIDFCSDLGGTRMIVGSPKQRNVLESDTYEAAWARTVTVFKDLAPHAGNEGICLCIEPLAPTETNFIQTAQEARRIVEAVDHSAFQMMLDVKAMCGDVEPIPEIIRKSCSYVRHFHANDEGLGGPGSGDTDFVPIARSLEECGYEGWVSVEVFDFSPGPEAIAHESITYLREVFEK
ncbi:MAG: sugar phosphate isomerase/epimerase family protein [Candidatus Brocadiia bacterium]